MNDQQELKTWRQQRLRALRSHQDFVTQGALAKALGLADGSYIGQMERGKRAITEKFIASAEALGDGKFRGWFALAGSTESALSPRAARVAALFDLLQPELQVRLEALIKELQLYEPKS